MTAYFGFIPTTELNEKINQTIDVVQNQPNTAFYPIQRDIINTIAHELLDNLFVHLVNIIENEKRKKKMERIVNTINSAVDTMLKHIVTEQPNDIVIDSFNFLLNDCIFVDNDGKRRIGFIISDDKYTTIIDNFNEAKINDGSCSEVQEAMGIIIKDNLTHFVNKFSSHLHLSLIKRKAIPVAESAINKASQIALNKLLPDMPQVANIRLIDHFESFIVVKDD